MNNALIMVSIIYKILIMPLAALGEEKKLDSSTPTDIKVNTPRKHVAISASQFTWVKGTLNMKNETNTKKIENSHIKTERLKTKAVIIWNLLIGNS